MSRRQQRALIEGDESRRATAIKRAEKEAPTDPLLALAYWTAIRDRAEELIYDAAVKTREAGHPWQIVGLAYGDRAAGAAHRKFHRVTG